MNTFSSKSIVPLTAILLLSSPLAFSGEKTGGCLEDKTKAAYEDAKVSVSNAWQEGRLETAFLLNEHLNNFKISIDVDKTKATLTGEVESEVQRDLARNIALGLKGIEEVDNKLEVSSNAKMKETKQKDTFSQYISDISLEASIKSELLYNQNVKGLSIDVDAENQKVTLSGSVDSEEQRELAEAIVKKRQDVEKVVNNLKINS